jgi:rhodanese-related sulfurtransferase
MSISSVHHERACFGMERMTMRVENLNWMVWVVSVGLGAGLVTGCDPSVARVADSPMRVTEIDVVEAAALVGGGQVVVLDVRTAGEFESGHIPGATNVDFRSGDFEERLRALDRERTYLVHCATGGRSSRALETFERLGFKSVVHMRSGFKGWEAKQNHWGRIIGAE